MVFLSFVNFISKTGYDHSLRRHRIFRMSAKYFSRRRNCYSMAIRSVHKALLYTTRARKLRNDYTHSLRITRLDAACEEHDTSYKTVAENLIKSNVNLNSGTLVNLAIWEPRTFKSIAEIARMKYKLVAPDDVKKFVAEPDGVITRGML